MAAGPQQIAAEGYRNHGLFTYALLEGLAKAGNEDKVQLYDLAGYVQTRVPDPSRELSVCDAKGPREYCKKPIVRLGERPNYPLAPRYPHTGQVLSCETGLIPKCRSRNRFVHRCLLGQARALLVFDDHAKPNHEFVHGIVSDNRDAAFKSKPPVTVVSASAPLLGEEHEKPKSTSGNRKGKLQEQRAARGLANEPVPLMPPSVFENVYPLD
ncbi:MAG: hypothetical protein WBX25_17490 [Rhodomicrobium sp.]